MVEELRRLTYLLFCFALLALHTSCDGGNKKEAENPSSGELEIEAMQRLIDDRERVLARFKVNLDSEFDYSSLDKAVSDDFNKCIANDRHKFELCLDAARTHMVHTVDDVRYRLKNDLKTFTASATDSLIASLPGCYKDDQTRVLLKLVTTSQECVDEAAIQSAESSLINLVRMDFCYLEYSHSLLGLQQRLQFLNTVEAISCS